MEVVKPVVKTCHAKIISCKTLVTMLTLLVLAAIAIALIVMGSVHIQQCTVQQMIPKFMIVCGVTGLVIVLLCLCGYFLQNDQNKRCVFVFGVMVAIVMVFNLAWNVFASVWVFKEWQDWTNTPTDMRVHKCHVDTYLLAFAYLIMFWISLPFQIAVFIRRRQSNVENVIA